MLWQGPGVLEQPIPSDPLFSWAPPASACGLGLELVPLLAGLAWLRRRLRAAPAGGEPTR